MKFICFFISDIPLVTDFKTTVTPKLPCKVMYLVSCACLLVEGQHKCYAVTALYLAFCLETVLTG